MNQHDQMREALQAYLDAGHGQHADPVLQLHARKLAEQALAHVNETPKNEHDSADVLKRAPLVRLTDEDLDSVAKLKANALYRLCNKPERDDLKSAYKEVANALMDALIKKNGG